MDPLLCINYIIEYDAAMDDCYQEMDAIKQHRNIIIEWMAIKHQA